MAVDEIYIDFFGTFKRGSSRIYNSVVKGKMWKTGDARWDRDFCAFERPLSDLLICSHRSFSFAPTRTLMSHVAGFEESPTSRHDVTWGRIVYSRR